jgi:hypothetical protein
MAIPTIYTLEYSINQDAYHIDTIDRIIMTNRDLIQRKISNGYLLIGIYPTWELASDDRERHERINPNRLKEDYGTEANALI